MPAAIVLLARTRRAPDIIWNDAGIPANSSLGAAARFPVKGAELWRPKEAEAKEAAMACLLP